MNEQTSLKLWVLKFCLKIIYPKFNYHTFLVFLAIKYRINYHRKIIQRRDMNKFAVKSVPAHIQRLMVQGYLEDNLPVLLHRCIVISREEFIQLSSENLFYIDNGVLWLALKLTSDTKKKYEHLNGQNKNDNIFKHRLNFVTSEIHQKLWGESSFDSLDNAKIVPVVGSKLVTDNIAFTTENEHYSLLSSFGLSNYEDINVSFQPVPALECSPKIAATAEVSLIVNEYDLSNDFIKEILSNHFELPKLVSVNDVFSIDLTPNNTAKYHYKYLDLIENAAKLYFKCNKLDDLITSSNDSKPSLNKNVIKPYFIVRGVTQLSLGENVHILKPQDEFFNVRDSVKMGPLMSSCPSGLKQKFNQIQETILPFLTGDLNDLSTSMTSPIIPMLLLTGSLGSGRHSLIKIVAKYNGMNCMPIDCNSLQSSTAKQTESKVNAMIQKAKAAAPVIVLLDNFEVFAVDPENNEDCRIMEYFENIVTDLYLNYSKHPIIFIAVTERQELKPNILRLFLEKIHIPRLNSQQRLEVLYWLASVMQLSIDGEENNEIQPFDVNTDNPLLSQNAKEVLQRVAAKTETFQYGDIDTLVHFAMRESYIKQHNPYYKIKPNPDLRLLREEDFNAALESIRSLQSQHLDAPKIPKVYWEDIGGLEKLKKELLKTIEFPIKYPHLFKNSTLKRSGILLYGPPGCGKTLVAKAVSTELNVSFLSVKGPELLNMYIGQSEENVRKVFESARASSPCIVFLDELDALAPRRGAAGDSGGASDRVVSQLLAELDGVAGKEVFESARASSPCIVFLDELDALAPRRGAAGDSGGASDRVVSQLLAELDGVAGKEVFESARASSPCIVFLDELDALAPRRGAAGDSGGASDRVVSQLLAELDGVAGKEVFESARASSPCIVFLDELDALAPRRGAAGDSGGASDRVVSQLLAELDGVAGKEDADTSSFVFIMGATNRPDLLEQSLLRPGRLDKLIYVGPYCGPFEKTCVLKALCRNHKLRPSVNLEDVSCALPERCTGADLLGVVSCARSAAVRALVDNLHKGLVKESELSPDSVVIGVSELWQGVESFRPSVTDEELAYYESLQTQM